MLDLKSGRGPSVASSFDAFETNLRLDVPERVKAVATHNQMTLRLLAGGVAVATFLQGSFARKTMRAPLRDIDKVVLLPERLRDDLMSSPSGPDRAMDLLQGVLVSHDPTAVFDRSRHALKVALSGCSFTFDLVPAFETPGVDENVLIADRDTGKWVPSNTRTLVRVVADRNQCCDGRFVQQVRMAKEWAWGIVTQRGIEFPGLHIESIAYIAIRERMDHATACLRFFETGAQVLGGSYTDPTGVDLLSAKLAPAVALVMRSAFAEVAQRAAEAVACSAAGDDTTACRLWHDIFGEAFPAPPAPSEDSVLSQAFAGGSLVRGHVTARRSGPQLLRPTRSWRP